MPIRPAACASFRAYTKQSATRSGITSLLSQSCRQSRRELHCQSKGSDKVKGDRRGCRNARRARAAIRIQALHRGIAVRNVKREVMSISALFRTLSQEGDAVFGSSLAPNMSPLPDAGRTRFANYEAYVSNMEETSLLESRMMGLSADEAVTHRPQRDSDYLCSLESPKSRNLEAVQVETEMCATVPGNELSYVMSNGCLSEKSAAGA